MKFETIVVTAEPLIHFHHLQLLELFPRMYRTILTVPSVVAEVERLRAEGVYVPKISSLPFIEVCPPRDILTEEQSSGLTDRDKGIASLALSLASPLVMIEPRDSRRSIDHLKIPVTGTIGVLLKAKKDGKIKTLKPLLPLLQEAGLKLSPKAIFTALALAGEC